MSFLAGPPCRVEDSDVRACPGCPYKGPVCGSRGKLDSPIVFVGEAPGHEEVRHKLPLVGPSGEVFWNTFPLTSILKEEGIDPSDFLILNACQCLPPRKKDNPVQNTKNIIRAWTQCRGRLLEQITAYPRKLVVLMGNHANWAVTGDGTTKITLIRGQLKESPLAEIGILPTLHPAALLRGTGNYRQYRMDIQYAIDLLRGYPRKRPITPSYIVCDTPALVRQAVKRFMKKPVIDCDIETTGFNRFSDKILALGMSYDPRLVFIFPGALTIEDAIKFQAHHSWLDGAPSMLPYLKQFFRKYKGKLCWHNGKFDISFLRRPEEGDEQGYAEFPGYPEARVDEDTMLMSYTLDESRGIHDLEQVSSDLVGAPDYKYIIKRWVPYRRDSYAKIPRSVLYNYLAFDVSNTGQIRPIMRRKIAEDAKLEKLYTKLLIPSSETLYHIEHRGMPVVEYAVKRQQDRLQKELDDAEAQVQLAALKAGITEYVSPASPKQMARLIFDVLKYPVPKGMKRSTRKEVMEKLPQTPLIKAHRAYKKAQKQKTTYADTILKNIEPATGRVHPTLLIHGTRTGRLAHKIVANIPRDKRVRGMYSFAIPVPLSKPNIIVGIKPRRVFLKADLDQAELRVLAALSGDPELCAIYRSNKRKLHREVADEIWGSPGITDAKKGSTYKWGQEEYMRAKALNFGIVYGRQAPSIAMEFDIPDREAEGYIEMWKRKFPKAWDFLVECRNAPLKNKTIVTPFGRKKRHWIITPENIVGLQNEASNFPEQSCASDIVLEASSKLSPQLRERDVHIVFLVHDEILADSPDDPETISWAEQLIVKELEQAPRTWGITRVPFKADTSVGRRWGIYRSHKSGTTDDGHTWEEYLDSKIKLFDNPYDDNDEDLDLDELDEAAE